MSKKKKAAINFLKMVVARKIEQACATHISPKFVRPNAYFPGDADRLMKGMIEAHTQFPNKTLNIQHALEDRELFVADQSHVVMPPGDPGGVAVVHGLGFSRSRLSKCATSGHRYPRRAQTSGGCSDRRGRFEHEAENEA